MATEDAVRIIATSDHTSLRKELIGLAETIKAIEVLEYHDQNLLQGDPGSRSLMKQGMLDSLLTNLRCSALDRETKRTAEVACGCKIN